MGSKTKVITLDQLSQHTTAQDCWLLINAKVYDVTSFLKDHPGGDEVLLTAAGKDATEEFEDVGHGSAARLMMDEYYVGETDSSSIRKNTPKLENPPKSSLQMEDKGKSSSSSNSTLMILLILVSVAVLGFAVAVKYYK